jgi:protein disulfide isomerase
MSDSFSSDNLATFVRSYLSGSLSAKIKEDHSHAPEPTDEAGDEDSPFVVTLTDANFQAEVVDNDKDVLVEFYAPWCGHCKQLKPRYASLAKTLSKVDSVRIAAMDATANKVPAGFDVQGYPTLFFVKGNDKKNPVPYEGQREEKDMIKFIQQHASTQFSL